ncbi:MAG: ArdC family protein [Pirellulaceae bacterium]|nr:ArdC family protein [Pirellulaceae bacterium]
MNRDEALKKSDEALKELSTALQQGKSETLVEYLDMLSRFHQYSFGNCILIYLQKPDASFVAGFGRWKELNRFVRKGEKGISILAPMVGKKKKDAEASEVQAGPSSKASNEESPKVLYGFRVVYVFDVSQTEGEELPEFAPLGGDPGDKIQRLEEIIRGHGIEIEFVEGLPGDANGMSEGGKISINSTIPKPQMFSTMVHELAHELLHWGDRREATTKVVRETEAEAVAFVVCRSVGLECSTRAADYIQLWNGDDKILMQSLELIRTVASKIIHDLEPTKVEAEEVAHVA